MRPLAERAFDLLASASAPPDSTKVAAICVTTCDSPRSTENISTCAFVQSRPRSSPRGCWLTLPPPTRRPLRPPQPGVEVGELQVTDSNWSFSSNLPNESGPWGSVTVTNTNCTTPYRPGTAQAGAVIFTAPLTPGVPSTGTLQAFVGSSASGQVKLLPMADTGGVNVSASLDGLEPFVIGTTLTVCLTRRRAAAHARGHQRRPAAVAATNFDVTGVTTATTDAGQPLIAISGTQTTSTSINRQWVFFFLATSTSAPTPSTPASPHSSCRQSPDRIRSTSPTPIRGGGAR